MVNIVNLIGVPILVLVATQKHLHEGIHIIYQEAINSVVWLQTLKADPTKIIISPFVGTKYIGCIFKENWPPHCHGMGMTSRSSVFPFFKNETHD